MDRITGNRAMIENTSETQFDPTTDLSHIVCGSPEWHAFVDEHGYDPTDLSDFRETPNSPAVLAHAGVPAAAFAAPDSYDGPNRQQVQAVLRTWQGQAQRLLIRPSLARPSTMRPVVRAHLDVSRGRSAPRTRRASARAPSASGGDDPPPSSTGGLTAVDRSTEPATTAGISAWSGFRPHRNKEVNALTAVQWTELLDELEDEYFGIRVIEASFGWQLHDGRYRVRLSVEAPQTGQIYRLDCPLGWDGVSLDDSYAQPGELVA